MHRLAGNYLSSGDVANASSLYNSLEKLNPTKYSRMARICRVLSNPQSVPLPFRYDDICEALLDPSVPPEVLLRGSAEDVQKSFQRLAVCVHPDKNPNVRAKDAFLRLSHMKDKALELLQEKADARDGGAAPAAQQHSMEATGSGGARRPQRPPPVRSSNGHSSANSGSSITAASSKRRPIKHATPPLTPVTELQAAAVVSSGIDQLRHTTIKLNCLKRKDIADDFEIFSATQRTGQSSAFGSSETSLAECGEESLAATVPVLPRGKKAPLNRRRQPPLTPGENSTTAAHPLVTPLQQPNSSDPPVTSVTPSAAASPVQTPVILLKPSPPRPLALPQIRQTDTTGGDDTGTDPAESSRPPSAKLVNNDSIRQQIVAACLKLREMRTQNTNIRLTLDLSFEAYQRNKQNQ